MEDTKFEKYWQLIEKHTFKTAFYPLTSQVAEILMEEHTRWLTNRQPIDWTSCTGPLGDLRDCLAAFVAELPFGKNGLFVRLSTRSAKDAALTRPTIVETLCSEYLSLRKIEENFPLATVDSTFLHALYRVSTQLLRVDSVADALQLLVESKRIQDDLKSYCSTSMSTSASTSDSLTPTEMNFIIREFAAFDPENEFRAFVYRGKLTAITQYNEYCYFPSLSARADELLQLMKSFVESIVPDLPPSLQSSVFDLVCLVDEHSSWTVKVVELNPLAEFASSGLFTWETDWKIIQGQVPFEFRFHAIPPSFNSSHLPSDWLAVVNLSQASLGLISSSSH